MERRPSSEQGCKDSVGGGELQVSRVLAKLCTLGKSMKDFEEVCCAGGSLREMGLLLACQNCKQRFMSKMEISCKLLAY